MSNQWLRLWHDMPTDPKWRTIARLSQQSIGDVIAVYSFILVNASNAPERGRTHNLFAEDIASAIDIKTEQVEAIFAAMQGRVLDGDKVTGWETRQPIREDGSAERAKKWRESKKPVDKSKRTHPNANERPDKDTDTDKDKKEDTHTNAHQAREIGEFQKIFDAGCAVNPHLLTASTAIIHQWIADGVTALDAVPEIQRLGKQARSWKFFSGAVLDAKATRLNPLPRGKPNVTAPRKSTVDILREGTEKARAERMRQLSATPG